MTAPPQERSYDLFLVADGRRFYFRNEDRGIKLDGTGISWTAKGRPGGAPFADIAEVRMQSGGDWRNALNQCQIKFRNDTMLTVTDGNAYGATDDAQTPVYRDFVRDLHRRLVAAKLTPSIRFVAGYSQGNYAVVVSAAALLALIGLGGPFVLLIITGKLQALYTLVGGAFLTWPLYTMVNNNTPRSYDPVYPPGELME